MRVKKTLPGLSMGKRATALPPLYDKKGGLSGTKSAINMKAVTPLSVPENAVEEAQEQDQAKAETPYEEIVEQLVPNADSPKMTEEKSPYQEIDN